MAKGQPHHIERCGLAAAMTDQQIRSAFLALRKRRDVAALLGTSDRSLRAILYGFKCRKNYVEAQIPKKSGGVRRICVPPLRLRRLQRKLLSVLTVVYQPKPCVTGFVRGMSIADNADPHANKQYVLGFDLNDFFPTIHFGRVSGALQSDPYNLGTEAAITLAQILTHDDGHLPQGAPTSPITANLICVPLDNAMLALAKRHHLTYTRYADDITLSTTKRRFPESVAKMCSDGTCSLGLELIDLIRDFGFAVRDGKTRLRPTGRRQKVTGLVVNEFANIPRAYVRHLRAIIHDAELHGLVVAAQRHAAQRNAPVASASKEWLLRVLQGKLAYLKMVRGVDDHIYRRLASRALMLGVSIATPPPLCESMPQPLRGRRTTSIDWRMWVRRYGESVFQIRCTSQVTSKSGYGSAFCAGHNSIVTAGHNVEEVLPSGATSMRTLEVLGPTGIWNITGVMHGDVSAGHDIAIGHAAHPDRRYCLPIPTQERIPELGEEVASIGFPQIPQRDSALVVHVGHVESITIRPNRPICFISVSFPSGPALSGSPLIDRNGYCLGVMIENVFLGGGQPASTGQPAPSIGKPYGQAILIGHWRDIAGAPNHL